jgi:Fe-S-cluster-containing dehydrogenase component
VVRLGFAIDQNTCIGCHACTVACKTEHDIPLGQFRTWVKYVDKGEYPATSREFGVMRCNHCTDAPCVAICPTKALFKRADGIVDFDSDRCIGCKACQQGCPYDAIYIDESTHTAAKCNFCAHRIDAGLEPACVVVCPTESIWVGDLDDPSTALSRMVRTSDVAVRAPEQNTGPNVFYLAADPAVLDPLAAPVAATYLWARPDAHRLDVAAHVTVDPSTKARTTLNTAHPRPWGSRVTAYLWTKSVAAGALLLVAIGLLLGDVSGDLARIAAPAIALGFTALTGALLVWDLKRPARFLYIFFKPNVRSWLALGSFALAGFSAVAVAWLAAGVADLAGVVSGLRIPAIVGAVLAAGYTGFLFRQAEGRDLWQSPIMFWHLLAQAGMVGGGTLLVVAPWLDASHNAERFLLRAFVVSTLAHLVLLLVEYGREHRSRNAALAAHLVVAGPYARVFWAGVGVSLVSAGLAVSQWSSAAPLAGPLVAAGLLAQPALVAYESAFVRAGQDPPLS